MGERVLCECGCGLPAPIARFTNSARGYVKGEPMRWRQGHALRGRKGSRANNWKGGRSENGSGYVRVHRPDHPNAKSDGYIYEHVLVASRALGKPLPPGAEVHHVNGDRGDNRPRNLVVCSHSLHMAMHARMRALAL